MSFKVSLTGMNAALAELGVRSNNIANSATSGSVPASVTGVGAKTLATNSGTLARTGYTFAGWNDQSGNAVSGNTYSISDTNYLFYARWTANTYTLS